MTTLANFFFFKKKLRVTVDFFSLFSAMMTPFFSGNRIFFNVHQMDFFLIFARNILQVFSL